MAAWGVLCKNGDQSASNRGMPMYSESSVLETSIRWKAVLDGTRRERLPSLISVDSAQASLQTIWNVISKRDSRSANAWSCSRR
jgi:hypothetical protein